MQEYANIPRWMLSNFLGLSARKQIRLYREIMPEIAGK